MKIKNQIHLITTLLFVTTLSGCATYFERSAQNDCFKKDWAAAGFNASKSGDLYQPSWDEQDSSCKKYNVWSDQADFKHGYEVGLEAFCTEQNGFEFGIRNYGYHSICAENEQKKFNAAYSDGQRLYHARQNVESSESLYYEAEETIRHANKKRDILAEKIRTEDLDKKTKKKYVKERYNLKKSRESAQYNINSYQRDIEEAERKEASLSASLYNRYYTGDPDLEDSYSLDQSIVSEQRVVLESAILLYKPNKIEKETRKNLKEKINLITSHITENHNREFRFQVINDTKTLFVDKNDKEILLNPLSEFSQIPTLIFWDTKELKFQPIDPDLEAPLSELDLFINTY